MLATFAEITNSDIEFEIYDSHSILQILDGETNKQVRENLLIDKKAIITPEWKYIEGHGGDGFNRAYSPSKERFQNLPRNDGELYHIRIDSTESENLYKQMPEKVAEMREELERILDSR